MANVIARTGRPAIVMAPNKTLAAQLYYELRDFFPENAVEYFVSYYDYYQPEAYLLLTYRESLQCMVIFFGLPSQSLDAAAWAKRIGKLGDGENTLALKSCPIFISQIGEEAEIVLFDSLLSATILKFALWAMSVQDQIWWRGGGQQGSSLAGSLMNST